MAERYIPEHRRTQFKAKNTFKPEELRRRREEQQVEIRKAKREENLAKRRGITGGDGSARLGASLGAEADSDDDTVPTESQVSRSHIFVTRLLPSRRTPSLVEDWSRSTMRSLFFILYPLCIISVFPSVYFYLVGRCLANNFFALSFWTPPATSMPLVFIAAQALRILFAILRLVTYNADFL
jgi:hypothetical protein